MKCKGAIFDMDGLLFDTEKLFQQTWNEIAEEKGIQLPREFVKAISGTQWETDVPCEVRQNAMHSSGRDSLAVGLSPYTFP